MSTELHVPDLGESIEQVQIGTWLKAPGDYVEQDEILVEIDSDKATVQFPAPASGVLVERRLETGADAAVGDVLAILDEAAERPASADADDNADTENDTDNDTDTGGAAKQGQPEPEAQAESEPEPEPQAESEPEAGAKAAGDGASRGAAITPSARKLLREHGFDLDEARQLAGGRIDRAAAQRLVEGNSQAAATGAGPARREERVRMTPLRRTIARRLVEAQQQAALLTTFNEIDMSRVKEARRTHGERFQEVHGVKLGFMSFFVRAAVEALKAYPGLNAEVDGEEIVYRDYYDIGVAIGSKRGLVVPILQNAERLGFADVEQAIADFAERAEAGTLEPDELRGGTFTISNGGVYGSLLSTPIVNPPQSGVLGLHAIQDRPVGVEGAIELRPMMYVALTYDHRVVDGKEAVSWLVHLKNSLEDPARLLLEI